MVRAGVLLAAWACLAAPAHAQITGLATTDDGSVLYFSSPFSLAGSPDPAPVKIYVYDDTGFRLYTDQFPGNSPVIVTLSNPWVSADGSVVAYRGTYTTENICGFMEICWNTYTQTAVGTASAAPIVLNSAAVLSANGRYALIAGPVLLDLTTGQQTPIPQALPYDNVLLASVASDGSVLLYNLLWRPGSGVTYIAAAPTAAVLSDDASTVVYSKDIALYIYDVAAGSTRLFANGSAPSISRDGRWVAFLSPVNGVPQAWAVPSDGSQFLQLTNEPFGVTSAILSGNGNVVYAATAANAIWRFDLAAGTSTGILPPTAAPVYGTTFGGVAGSLASFGVTGLVPQTITATPPLPLTLAGYQVLLNGSPAPLLSISPETVVFQIPWEALMASSIQLATPDPHPIFQAPLQSIFVSPFSPRFLITPCAVPIVGQCIQAAHRDGTAVSSDSPAQPGETIDLFLTGMGPVSPPLPTGAAAPPTPPIVVEHPFACQLLQEDGNAPSPLGDLPVLAAVIPPGAVGVYRITVQLPAITGDSPYASVQCQGSDYYAPGFLPVATTRVPQPARSPISNSQECCRLNQLRTLASRTPT